MRKIIRIEQVPLPDGGEGERRSHYFVDENGVPQCPDRIIGALRTEWDRIMELLELDTPGLSKVVDATRLADFLEQA